MVGTMSVDVTVCIPTVRPSTLKSAIESIRRQSWTNWELLVVGQGPDPTLRSIAEQLTREDARIRYVHLQVMNVSHARNMAFELAQGEVIAFMDDDCEADPEWVANLVECFKRDPALGFVAGALLAPEFKGRMLAVCPQIQPEDVTYDPVKDYGHGPARFDVAGANLAIRASVARRVGGFDECMGGGAIFSSSEDLDYMLRVEAAGIRMRSTPLLVVHHTYGVRYGLKAVFRHRRSYAVGQGALAAKMTLRGDPRGRKWLSTVWGDFTQTFRERRFHRSPSAFMRYLYVLKSYEHCVRNHEVDNVTGLFKPKAP
jgi:glycosyltransferase involved in cell wall biosynthesis